MNIRYRFGNHENQNIHEHILAIWDVERGFVGRYEQDGWYILSRDLGTGSKDKNDKELFQCDRVRVHWEEMFFKGDVEGIIDYDPYQAYFMVDFPEHGCGTALSAIASDDIEIIGRSDE